MATKVKIVSNVLFIELIKCTEKLIFKKQGFGQSSRFMSLPGNPGSINL